MASIAALCVGSELSILQRQYVLFGTCGISGVGRCDCEIKNCLLMAAVEV